MLFVCSLLAFAVSPVCSVPILLFGVYHRRRWALALLILALATISIYYPPSGDQYRYWLDFQNIENFGSFFENEDLYRRVSLPMLIMFYVKTLGMNFEIVRFACIVFSLAVVTWCYVDYIRRHKSTVVKRLLFLGYLIILAGFPFLPICQGYRQGMGTCFGVAAFYLLANRSHVRMAYLMLFLSVASHLSCLALLPLFWLAHKKEIALWSFFKLSLLALLAVFVLDFGFSWVSPVLPDKLQFLNYYLAQGGEWRDVSASQSLRHRIVQAVCYFALYLSVTVFVVSTKNRQVKNGEDVYSYDLYSRVIMWFTLLWVAILPYSTFAWRFFYMLVAFLAMGWALLINAEGGFKKGRLLGIVLLLVASLYVPCEYFPAFRLVNPRDLLGNNIGSSLCYSYDEVFISRYINDDGGLE